MLKKRWIVLWVAAVFGLGMGAVSTAEEDPLDSKAPAVNVATSKTTPQASASLLIDDYSDGDLVNALNGESGAWVIDPEDPGSECTPAIVQVSDLGDKNSVLKLAYRLDSKQRAQNGFWTKLRNVDASAYDHLVFDVKGDEAGFTRSFILQLKKFKDAARTEKITGNFRVENVTNRWQTVQIPLNVMTGILDFANPEVWKNPAISQKDLEELVIVFHDRHVTAKTGTIYLDNIRFVKTGNPGPTAVDFPPRKGEKTPTPLTGLDFAKFLVSRLRAYPSQLLVAKTWPEDDRALFMELAKDTWKFFDGVVDKEHHLPLDQVQMGKEAPLSEGAWIGDYTNITNVGVYFMAVVSAYDFKFIDQADAVARLKATIESVEKLEYHSSGFPYNYYDTTTAERTSYFVSFVDSAWLAAGLYVAKQAFPAELGAVADRLLKRFNFGFFYDNVEQQMYHGYYANLNAYSNYHYGSFYSESRAGSYIAIARGEVPLEHWFRTERVFPESYTWQRSAPVARVVKETLGVRYPGGFYEWNGLRFVPSWGGSAFEALMPQLVLDEPGLSPESLGKNGEVHTQGQIRFAKSEKNYPVWGMSPSAIPDGGYSEYGAAPFGSKGYQAGVVTPHASVLGVAYAPHDVAENVRELSKRYPIYGEYGFYDAVSPETGHVAQKYLCLDQGMLFVALGNYLNDNSIRKRFHQDPAMKTAEKLLTEEKLFEPLGAPVGSTAGGSDVLMEPVAKGEKVS